VGRAHCALGKVSYRKRTGPGAARLRHRAPDVIKQNPSRGRRLKAGTTVRLLLVRG
jgi:hypothetical protein